MAMCRQVTMSFSCTGRPGNSMWHHMPGEANKLAKPEEGKIMAGNWLLLGVQWISSEREYSRTGKRWRHVWIQKLQACFFVGISENVYGPKTKGPSVQFVMPTWCPFDRSWGLTDMHILDHWASYIQELHYHIRSKIYYALMHLDEQ